MNQRTQHIDVPRPTRGIGPLGTTLRALVGAGLLYLAGGADGLSWGVEWYDPAVGLVALPGLTILLGVTTRRYAARPLRLTGPGGHAANCALIVALVANPYTSGGATLFYATTMLVAAVRGQPGCEMTVLSNWLLRRDDQVGCPLFAPVDALDTRQRTRRANRPPAAIEEAPGHVASR